MSGRSLDVLFLNAGRRVELINSFRAAGQALGLQVDIVASDIQGLAPALYEAERSALLPRSAEPGFVEALTALCRRERIGLVVPLIDPDLPVLAKHKTLIEESGARVLVSDPSAIEICADKGATSAFLADRGFAGPRLYEARDLPNAGFPLFVKPRGGSSSIDAYKVETPAHLAFLLDHVPDAIVQEFVPGPEFTIDVFCDWQSEPLVAVPRERLRVRHGEASVARVRRDDQMESLAMAVARALPAVGPINVQMIAGPEGPRIIEINPRFGGGCPLSLAAGAPMASWTLLMALGRDPGTLPAKVRDGLTMMRHDTSVFLDADQVLK